MKWRRSERARIGKDMGHDGSDDGLRALSMGESDDTLAGQELNKCRITARIGCSRFVRRFGFIFSWTIDRAVQQPMIFQA